MKLLNTLIVFAGLGTGFTYAQNADIIITNGKITTMDAKIRKYRPWL
jgi:hypothetical protein